MDGCTKTLAADETKRQTEQRNRRLNDFLTEYDLSDDQELQIPAHFIADATPLRARTVPIERIVNFCQAQRVKLNSLELKEVQESRPWTALSKKDQLKVIFLALTKEGCRWPDGYNPATVAPGLDEMRMHYPAQLEDRRMWLNNGVPFDQAEAHIYIIWNSMLERQRVKGKEGAEKKRRKPRAPKGAWGKFETKNRDTGPANSGKFKKQSI